ncbi:hypothetical protein NLG97_g6918 [Lecanicillium saksenae]|uniref:Uncharacterized protein n=1 Tax=Lecanicillium saksenae TaxID=468837 RepID=A0ACC1QPZ2_9HYPO|nr:hypothetical protein NLG97_g6918 [Lecanicillium saksenae]
MARSTEYSKLAQTYGIPDEYFPLNKQQILQTLRIIQETHHQAKIYEDSARHGFLDGSFHIPVDFGSISGLSMQDANASCNRTAPIFVLRDNSYPDDGPWHILPNFHLLRDNISTDTPAKNLEALLVLMHVYIYGRWMRPYESIIDRNQFLTKVHVPVAMSLHPVCSLDMVDLVRKMSTNLIARIKHTKPQRVSYEEEDACEIFYHLQPLFEAVAIALKSVNFDPKTPDVAALPVLIVRTGVEHLSAPITFDSTPMSERLNDCSDSTGTLVAVETRLETAITFLIELEQREAQASPPFPDPALVTRDMARAEVRNRFAHIVSTLG